MKTTVCKIFLFFLLLIRNFSAEASHAAGGEITYECTGANQYTITLTLYRDCSGVTLNPTQTIRITNSCGLTNPVSVSLNLLSTQQFGSVCSSSLTTCNGGIAFGLARHTYEGTVTLPGACNEWSLSNTVVNRNSNTTTVGSSSDSMFIFSVINNQNSICNNSPIFSSAATGIFFTDYYSCYSNGAYDIDGDSLTFELATPRTGPSASDTVTYLSGYSLTAPISSSVPITFGSSGELCFNGTQQEVSVYAVLVSEFRNGVLIGQVQRDIELRLRPDPVTNHSPVLSGIDGGSVFNIVGCPSTAINFSVIGFDPDSAEDLTTYWNQGIAGGTFTTNTTSASNADTAFFSWTPQNSDVSSTPHCFTVYTHDDHCPYTGIDSQLFCITVYPPSDPWCINPGIDEHTNAALFEIYPNPAKGELWMRPQNIPDRKTIVMIYNSTGQKVFSDELFLTNEKRFDVSGWEKGVYECVLISGEDSFVRRIILL